MDILDTIATLSVTVRVRNLWRLRLGMFVLGIAARILRCRIHINETTVGEIEP